MARRLPRLEIPKVEWAAVDVATGGLVSIMRGCDAASHTSGCHSAVEALMELLEGPREHAGIDTPPLSPATGGPVRIRELATGLGARDR